MKACYHFPAVLAFFICSTVVSAQAPANDHNTTWSRQTGSFRIPFSVDPADRRINRVELYLSEDKGQNWNQVASVSPRERTEFHYQLVRDGTYCFALRTVDVLGNGYPKTMDKTVPPQQRVIIDTQRPVVTLRSLPAPGGQVGVEWQVTDEHIDLNNLILEYRTGTAGEWLPLSMDRLATGRKTWNPSTNAAIQVRLRAVDLAGNTAEETTTVSAGAGGNAAAGSRLSTYGEGNGASASPPATGGVKTLFVNSKRISLNYELKDVGPSKVSVVELWYTIDGRNWQKYSEDRNARSPYVVDVQNEGIYGFTLLARSGVGQGDPPPKVGDLPQVWVEVDLTKPVVQLRGVEVGRGQDSGKLTVTWSATDKNLGRQPVTLSYAERIDGSWTPIAANLDNSTGQYIWHMPSGVPYSFFVKVEAVDQAGNIGSDQTDLSKPVIVDLSMPKVHVITVEPAGAGK